MQYINLNKIIDLKDEIKELILISIDEQIDTADDKDGVKITGKITVGGKVNTIEGEKEFSDYIDLDIYLTYEEITDRSFLSVNVNDFNYKIDNNYLKLDISLKLDGLKEIETTFLSEEDNEFFSEEEVNEEDDNVYVDEEIMINKEDRELCENSIVDLNVENETIYTEKETIIKKSLLKSVFSNKRIKEEVSWRVHCVKKEKTYEEIASIYSVSVSKLKTLNKNEKIEEGKLIFIPID